MFVHSVKSELKNMFSEENASFKMEMREEQMCDSVLRLSTFHQINLQFQHILIEVLLYR